MFSQHSKSAMRVLAFASAFGFTMAASALFGLWVGLFLDRKLGTSPWLTLIMVCLSIFAAFRQSIRHLRRLIEEDKK